MAKGGPGKASKTLVTVITVLVLLIAAGTVGYVIVRGKPAKGDPGSNGASNKAGSNTDSVEAELGPMYAFETFIVNVAEAMNRRYLKCALTMELDNAAGTAEAVARVALLRDAVIDILSAKTMAELEPGPARDELRRALAKKLDSVMTESRVRRVFFSEFVVQ
ncbi:MAG: flagellar basal body-associated FliL family protein [Clostridia bacterium]|nr:flagellar basal body-associated FliL family protein [Clostridia bacterium]